jgi:hypothetical protein
MGQRRRGKGEGSIRQRSDGRWEVRLDLGRGLDGQRRRKSVFADTERAAIAALKQLHGRSVAGHVLGTSTPTVARFLEDWYAMNRDTWRPSTRRSYRGAIDGHLVPAFVAALLTAADLRPLGTPAHGRSLRAPPGADRGDGGQGHGRALRRTERSLGGQIGGQTGRTESRFSKNG